MTNIGFCENLLFLDFPGNVPVKISLSHIHVWYNPEKTNPTGKKTKKHETDKTQAQIKVTSFVSVHEFSAFFQ